MPHFGRIQEGLEPAEEFLIRSRLHFHGGDLRWKNGEYSDAYASYYDALSYAMKRVFVSDNPSECHVLPKVPDMEDDETLFIELHGVGVINERISMSDFYWIQSHLEMAFEGKIVEGHLERFKALLEDVLTQLGILPFKEEDLPKGESLTL